MTLGNMRANGVRTLAVWCHGCGRGSRAIDAIKCLTHIATSLHEPGQALSLSRCGRLPADPQTPEGTP